MKRILYLLIVSLLVANCWQSSDKKEGNEVTQTNDNVKPEQTPDALHISTNETHAQPEKDEVKQKETQTTLPKTGTANSLGLLSVATSSILFGLGFFILSKKEDEE